MEDPRYKTAASQADCPPCNGPLQSVVIEMEDTRCTSLVDRVAFEVEDCRCRTVTVQMEDPRCQNLRMGW
jgi:hypothetical protein